MVQGVITDPCIANSTSESTLIESATIGDNCTPISINLRSDSDSDSDSTIPLETPSLTTKETPSIIIPQLFYLELRINNATTSIYLRSPKDLSFINKNIIETASGKTVCDIPNEAI